MDYTDEIDATGPDSTVSLVFRLIDQAEQFADTQEKARAKALAYYNADPAATPGAGDGFSSVVSAR